MIRCNLSILLAERKLKITKVCADTGISRTTLTYLVNNYSKGIQYDTLNTLCSYLKVTPADLISYVPIDLKVCHAYCTGNEEKTLDIELLITKNGTEKICGLCGNVFLTFSDFDAPDFDSSHYAKIPIKADIYIALWMPQDENDYETITENAFITSTIRSLPTTFLTDFEEQITDEIIINISREYHMDYTIMEPIETTFQWSPDILS